jgi:hypothetical protein
MKAHLHYMHEPSSRRGTKACRVIGWTFTGVLMAVVFALVFGLAVKWLWNWLMPALFGLGAITYWQAFGIVILTKLLFGSFGHHHDKPDSFKSKFHEKWHRSFGEEDKESMSHEYMQDYHKYYRTYWREEGKKAFEDYVQKIKAQKQESAKE